MSGLIAVFQRELRAYFLSPLAYVVLTFFLLLNGYVFSLIVSYLSDPRAGGSTTPLKLFFGNTLFFWVVMLFIVPVLTMRLISEEMKSGTIESLMTAPITEGQVILAKYMASLAFYAFLWLPTLVYVAIVAKSSPVDWGPIAAGYLGILCIGAMFLSIGVFASSFSKNQIVAAVASFAMLVLFWSIGFIDGLITDDGVKDVIGYVDVITHMEDFGKGIIDTRRLVYYLSTTALFLFLAARTLESKKWSS